VPTDRINFSYYTFTWTWFYYSYFVTTIPFDTTTQTSSRVTTTTTISVYNTNSAAASRQFASISAEVTFPSAFTAPGFDNPGPTTATAAKAGGTTATGSSSSVQVGAVSAAERRVDGVMVLWLVGCVSMGMVMVWL